MHAVRRISPPGALPPLVWAAAAMPALAQPVQLDPRLVIQEAQQAYRAGPTAEQVTATLRIEGAHPRRPMVMQQRFTVRIAPPAPEAEGPTQALLELGDVTVALRDGLLTASSTWNEQRVLVRDLESFPGPLDLAATLPPIPAPQLALVADDDFSTPTPYTPDVRWVQASADPDAPMQLVIMEGQGPHGPVTLVTDAQTGRLLKMTAAVASDPPAKLDLLFEPIDPGDPTAWRIDTAGREIVASATELGLPQAPEPPEPEPELIFRNAEGDPWRPGAGEMANAHAAAVILIPAQRDPDRALRAAAVAAIAAGLAQTPGPLRTRAAVAFPPGGFGAAAFNQLRQGWSAELARRERVAEDLLWTEAPPHVLTPSLAEADALLLLIGSDGERLAPLPLRADATAEALAQEISRLLREPPQEPDTRPTPTEPSGG